MGNTVIGSPNDLTFLAHIQCWDCALNSLACRHTANWWQNRGSHKWPNRNKLKNNCWSSKSLGNERWCLFESLEKRLGFFLVVSLGGFEAIFDPKILFFGPARYSDFEKFSMEALIKYVLKLKKC